MNTKALLPEKASQKWLREKGFSKPLIDLLTPLCQHGFHIKNCRYVTHEETDQESKNWRKYFPFIQLAPARLVVAKAEVDEVESQWTAKNAFMEAERLRALIQNSTNRQKFPNLTVIVGRPRWQGLTRAGIETCSAVGNFEIFDHIITLCDAGAESWHELPEEVINLTGTKDFQQRTMNEMTAFLNSLRDHP